MFVMDVPNLPFQESVVSNASATTQPNTQKFDRVIGVCHLSENPYDTLSAVNTMSPALVIENYFFDRGQKAPGKAKATVMKMPDHGKLEDVGDGNYAYYPDKAYKGGDRATLMVEMSGKKVKMEYFFRVMQTIPQEYEDSPSPYELSGCPKKVPVWKISSLTDFKGNKTLVAVEAP
ncbi:MAG: hypothetical protein V4447_16145 [Pseudomonadota bacterium]